MISGARYWKKQVKFRFAPVLLYSGVFSVWFAGNYSRLCQATVISLKLLCSILFVQFVSKTETHWRFIWGPFCGKWNVGRAWKYIKSPMRKVARSSQGITVKFLSRVYKTRHFGDKSPDLATPLKGQYIFVNKGPIPWRNSTLLVGLELKRPWESGKAQLTWPKTVQTTVYIVAYSVASIPSHITLPRLLLVNHDTNDGAAAVSLHLIIVWVDISRQLKSLSALHQCQRGHRKVRLLFEINLHAAFRVPLILGCE